MADLRPLEVINQDAEHGMTPGIAESDCESGEGRLLDSGSRSDVERYEILRVRRV